jgi:hypothetical protein
MGGVRYQGRDGGVLPKWAVAPELPVLVTVYKRQPELCPKKKCDSLSLDRGVEKAKWLRTRSLPTASGQAVTGWTGENHLQCRGRSPKSNGRKRDMATFGRLLHDICSDSSLQACSWATSCELLLYRHTYLPFLPLVCQAYWLCSLDASPLQQEAVPWDLMAADCRTVVLLCSNTMPDMVKEMLTSVRLFDAHHAPWASESISSGSASGFVLSPRFLTALGFFKTMPGTLQVVEDVSADFDARSFKSSKNLAGIFSPAASISHCTVCAPASGFTDWA